MNRPLLFEVNMKSRILFAVTVVLSLVLAAPARATALAPVAGGVEADVTGGRLRIEVVTDKIVHVTVTPAGVTAAPSLMRRPGLKPAGNFTVSMVEGGEVVDTGALKAVVSLPDGTVWFQRPDGSPILKEAAGREFSPSPDAGCGLQIKQGFVLLSDEGLYGLGEYQDGVINWRGRDVLLAQANTEAAVPFLLSTGGWGILWDNDSLTRFASRDRHFSFWSEASDGVDYYFVYGPTPDEVIAGYREITGAAPMFPKWAFGYWQSKERYKTQQELVAVATEYRRRQLPIDVIVQDWQYWGALGWNAMAFDPATFPDPAAAFSALHDLNFRVMISVWPKFGGGTDVFRDFDARGFIFHNFHVRDQYVYDAFNPEARKLYWDYMNRAFFSIGMDSWWLDATEPEFNLVSTQQMFTDNMKAAGKNFLGPPARHLNAYALMTTSAVYEGQRATTDRKRVVILTRSAFAGMQRNAAMLWSGDIWAGWKVFGKQIPAGLNLCMSGIPYWTTDIGGFFVKYPGGNRNPAYRELYVRWFQFGAFCPVFRSHGTSTAREMWRFGGDDSWQYHALKQADRLRYRLLPYIYSLAWQVTSAGQTMMRALPMDFPDDPGSRAIANQYLFGPLLMVSPIVEPVKNGWLNPTWLNLYRTNPAADCDRMKSTRQVYLPPGQWYDFWTGERMNGGAIEKTVGMDAIPLHVRAGAILPLGPDLQYATEKPADPIELRVYRGADGSFDLYEDEGDNYNYEQGAYAVIPIRWSEADGTLTLGARRGSFPGMLETRTFNLVVVGKGKGAGLEPEPLPYRTAIYNGGELKIKLE
jgi:alpha-D-xyloside xylohydrolase